MRQGKKRGAEKGREDSKGKCKGASLRSELIDEKEGKKARVSKEEKNLIEETNDAIWPRR